MEVDFQRVYGLEVAGLWAERKWRQLLNYAKNLPRNSLFQEAISQDDELADELISQEDPNEESSSIFPLYHFSPEVEVLMQLVDRVGSLQSAVIASAGGKPKAVRPMKRPQTAIARARSRADLARHRALVARVLPEDNSEGRHRSGGD